MITTNYDGLFEEAWSLSDPDGLSVLPGAIKPDARRWLLKMHGCLSDPDRVVLTRSSYTRYDERLPALTGMVQAFLVTRHVSSFQGYGLGSYCFFDLGLPIESSTAFEVPDTPGVQLHDLLTRFLNGSGGIENVVNSTGAAVDSANPGPTDVISYP